MAVTAPMDPWTCSYIFIHRSMTAPMDLYIQVHAWSYVIIRRAMTAHMDLNNYK